MVKALIKAGADINLSGDGLLPPVVAAMNSGHQEIKQLLLDAGVVMRTIPPAPQELVPDAAASSPSEAMKSLKYRHIPADLIASDDKESLVGNQLLRCERYTRKKGVVSIFHRRRN